MGLIWVYFRFDSSINEYELIRRQKVTETIQWLYQAVNDVCYRCNMSPIYNITETSQITYTDKVISPHSIKGSIYLVIWNDKLGRVYHNNTLIYAVLHEIAHILSPSIHHEPPFDSIESLLLNTAIELGYYDSTIPIDPSYITLDLERKELISTSSTTMAATAERFLIISIFNYNIPIDPSYITLDLERKELISTSSTTMAATAEKISHNFHI